MHGGERFFGCAGHVLKSSKFLSLKTVRSGLVSDYLSTLGTLLYIGVPAEHDFERAAKKSLRWYARTTCEPTTCAKHASAISNGTSLSANHERPIERRP